MVGHSTNAIDWTFDSSLTASSLFGVVHIRGHFLAASADGSTLRSRDGLHWDSPNFGGRDLNAVAATSSPFGTGTGFVAVGQHGTILTSTNGWEWVRQNSGTTNNLLGVGGGFGVTVVTGEKGTLLSSRDLRHWVTSPIDPTVAASSLYGVAYGNHRYVTAGAFLSSANGLSWEVPPGQEANLSRYLLPVVFDGHQFVGFALRINLQVRFALIAHSTDGKNWTYTGLPESFFPSSNVTRPSLAYGNGRYVLTVNNRCLVSTDSTNWQDVTVSPPLGLDILRRVTYAGDYFLGLSNSGFLYVSTDGTNWQQGPLPGDFTHIINDLAYQDGVYVAVGAAGTLYYSGPQNPLRLGQSLAVRGVGFQLGLSGRYNQSYQVQYTTNLLDWASLTNLTQSSPDIIQRVIDSDAGAGPIRAYRVVEQ